MSTEPASLIPIMKGVCSTFLHVDCLSTGSFFFFFWGQSQHLALIGDHKQLPPVIISKEAKEGGLNISLFERLTEEGRELLLEFWPQRFH